MNPGDVNARRAILILGCATVSVTGIFAFQREFREYPGQEYTDFKLPDDYKIPAEFSFGRLMYPEGRYGGGFGFRFGGGDWREGYTDWTNDYPRSDRHLMVALRRLTRVDARSVEQPVNLDDGDDVYNWPFLYAARAGFMQLTDLQNAKLRDYLDRGGFFIGDDMWGDNEYAGAVESMARVFPKSPLEELPNDAQAFHTVFDLDQRYQILGQWGLRTGQPLNGGYVSHWQGIFDEKKRMVVGIWVNSDTGDSWEWADDPTYPERYSALGMRLMLNHIIYAMTH